MQLYIGNKNYSSWSLRSWLLLKQFDIGFEEVALRLDFDAGSAFKTRLAALGASGKVPVLVDDGFAVWDTLAIAEYVAEKYPEHQLWPTDIRARARARSLCAEMHSGFTALRHHCPMNIEASLPDVGERLQRDLPELRADLQRIVDVWTSQLEAHCGPFLFGAFSIADAYFAPVCSRIATYGLAVPPGAGGYVDRMLGLPSMLEWSAEAKAENDFLVFDEPYRQLT